MTWPDGYLDGKRKLNSYLKLERAPSSLWSLSPMPQREPERSENPRETSRGEEKLWWFYIWQNWKSTLSLKTSDIFKTLLKETAARPLHVFLAARIVAFWFYFQHCKRWLYYRLSSPCCGWLAFKGFYLRKGYTCFENTRTTLSIARCQHYERSGSLHRWGEC